jgi:uncharacterized protein (TIGR02246 family)
MNVKSNRWLSKFKLMSILAKSEIFVTICVFIAGYSNMSAAQTAEDSASVYKFVQKYQHTFNTRDATALSEFFTEDADFLMFNLPEIRGRQAIENLWRSYWQSKFNKQESGRKGKFFLNSVKFFSSDYALVNIESITGGRDSLGVELQTRKARGTWLLHHQNGNWFISALCGMPTERDSIILKTSLETAKSLRPHIRAFVDAYEDAFNSHDPSAVSAFFRNGADIIVRNNPLIQSKHAIQKMWNTYFSKPRNYRALFIIDRIRAISDAVVQVNLTVTGAIPGTEDKLQPVRQTSAMWILVRESGKWHITALRVLPGKDDIIIRR